MTYSLTNKTWAKLAAEQPQVCIIIIKFNIFYEWVNFNWKQKWKDQRPQSAVRLLSPSVRPLWQPQDLLSHQILKQLVWVAATQTCSRKLVFSFSRVAADLSFYYVWFFKGLAFSAMAVGKNTLYMLGGRESLYMNSQVYLSVLASVFSICLLYFYVCLYMNSQIFLFVLVYLLICLFICILIYSKSVSLSTCLFYLSFSLYMNSQVYIS